MRIPIKIYKSFIGTILSLLSLFPLLGGVGIIIASVSSGDVPIIILGVLGGIVCIVFHWLLQELAGYVTERKTIQQMDKGAQGKGRRGRYCFIC